MQAYTHRREQNPPEDHGCFTARNYSRKTDLWTFDSYPWIYTDNLGQNARANGEALAQVLRDESTHYHLWHYVAARMVNWVINCRREDSSSEKPYLITEYGLGPNEEGAGRLPDRALRSYVHYASWAAFASGHCGVPLKWFGLDCLKDVTPIAVFWNSLREKGIAGLLMVRILPSSEPVRPPVIIGLKSKDNRKAVLWLFHDEKIDKVGRSYAQPKANNLAERQIKCTLPAMDPGAIYKVTPYNTWTGRIEQGPQFRIPDVKADAGGRLIIPVGALSETTEDVWDGTDIVYLLEQ